MREILFRGKRKDNGEWIEGHLLWYEDGRARIIPRHTDIFCYENDENTIQTLAYEVTPETVGQYAGLNDKNGNKIFEGDIVKDVTIPLQCGGGIVKFGNYEMITHHSMINDNYSYHMGFYIEWMKTVNFYRKDFVFWNEKVEIIGNIHNNPELVGNSDQLEE